MNHNTILTERELLTENYRFWRNHCDALAEERQRNLTLPLCSDVEELDRMYYTNSVAAHRADKARAAVRKANEL